MRTVLTIVSALLLTACAFAGGVLAGPSMMPPEEDASAGGGGWAGGGPTGVVVTVVRKQQYLDRIEAIGTARANESVWITSRVTESVEEILFKDGQFVPADTELVRLTSAEEQAQHEVAKAQLDELAAQLKRLQGLSIQSDLAQAELDEQKAKVAAAEAELRVIEARMADRLLVAPFAGFVGLRQISRGTVVGTGTRIVTLDDIDTIKLDAPIPESFIADVRAGMPLVARSIAYPDRVFSGEVVGIDTRVDPNTRAIVLRAEIPNPEHLLRPGMLLTVEVTRASRETILIPEESLLTLRDRHSVYVVTADNVVERVIVELGKRGAGVVEITKGLEPGQRVVTEGIIKIGPGTPVEVLDTIDVEADSSPQGGGRSTAQ